MKRIATFLLFAGFFSFLSIPVYSQMTGSYTVDPAGGEDYLTVQEACDSLLNQGISGAVTINITDGYYDEQVTLDGAIAGTSAANTVTFQSLSNDASKVVIRYTGTSSANWVFKIGEADYVTLRHITLQTTADYYSRVLDFNNSARNVTIENCIFYGYSTTSTYDRYALIYSTQDSLSDLTIQNNIFNNGSIGICLYGKSSYLTPNLQILNNEFNDQGEDGINLQYQNAPIIKDNTFEMDMDPANAIYMYRVDNAFQILTNKINMASKGHQGINLDECDGDALQKALIANNFISIQGTSTARGIYLDYSTNLNIFYNSVNITSTATGTSAAALYDYYSSDIDVRNNIFANFGGSYALYTNSTTAIINSDYNNYFTAGNFIAYWNNNIQDLDDLRTATTMDDNSISVSPIFDDVSDLHISSVILDGQGADQGLGITTDIDGDTRTDFDIGADEFTGTGTALSGTYTIGETGATFTSFSSAVDSMKKVGISSSVVFNVLDGEYVEQFLIYPVAGASETNTITFQSESGDPDEVNLSFTSGSSNDYVVGIEGADFITFKNMTIQADDATYGTVIRFNGNASNDSILNCILNSTNAISYTEISVINSYQGAIKNIVIAGNTITGGGHGIMFNTNNVVMAKGIEVLNNTISGNNYAYNSFGIYLRSLDAPLVADNVITNTINDDFYGIHAMYCNNDMKILRNKINMTVDEVGIKLYSCSGGSTSAKKGLVANNVIQIGGTSYARGIHIYDSKNQNIYYNTVKITSTNSLYAYAFYNEHSSNSSDLVLKNNIFSNFGGGYALYSNSTTDIDESDYNDLYSTGNFLVSWDAASYTDLAAYQTASSLDANSVSANPSFVSETDLHAQSSFIDSSGADIDDVVAEDIEGNPRDADTPDIGAYEFASTLLPLAEGTYYIAAGATAPDYVSFTAAVADLNDRGISGPVVFSVADDSYEEQITILDINGADATNTITFQSESGDPGAVELSYTANENKKYVVQLSGTDFISFKDMTLTANDETYGLVFFFRGGMEDVTISNCVLNGTGESYGSEYNKSVIYSGDAIIHDLTISGCTITGGRSGIWLRSTTDNHATGTVIQDNVIDDQYYDAVYLQYHDAPQVIDNIITMSSGQYYYGIYLYYCDDDLLVTGNRITTNYSYGGIYLYYCEGTTAKRGLTANNFIDIGGSSSAYGINSYYSDYQQIYYNTIRITSTYTSYSYAYYDYGSDNMEIVNNILANIGGGYAYYTSSPDGITTSDYNDLFTTGNYIGYWNGQRASLEEFTTESGMDLNSISINPSFVSATDIHTTSSYLDSAGTDLSDVIDLDIDGDARDPNKPDIGADEFTATTFPLSGPYSIDKSGGDYESFSAAVDALNNLGVSGPVTFNVAEEIYEEQFELFEIPGISATDTVVFQSATGDSVRTILSFDAKNSNENYIIKLSGADYITFKNLSLVATNSSYATVIQINGSVNKLNILNNIIISSTDAYSYVITSTNNNITNDLLIQNNYIIEGGYGIYIEGNSSTHSQNVRIIGNTLDNQYYEGIHLAYMNAPVVIDNIVSTNSQYYYGFEGIYLNSCDNDLLLTGNQVTMNDDGYGITLYYCAGLYIRPGLVANNFVGIGGNSEAYGIYLYDSDYQNIYHNSVNITSTYGTESYKRAFYAYYGDDLNVVNNNFACTNGGYAYYIGTTTAIVSSDYNNLYTTGTNLAYWGADMAALSTLRGASGLDLNTLSIDPKFLSATSYVSGQAGLHEAATPLALVTKDIDGTTRDLATPDIGAYEFYCETPAFNIAVLPFCFGDSTTFMDKSTGIAPGSTYSWDFDNDYNPEKSSDKGRDTVRYRFAETGTMTVNFIVSQIAGCNDYEAINIDVNPSVVFNVEIEGAYCGNDDGTATVHVLEGSGPFNYRWSTGSSDSVADDLAIGTYTVAVSDVNECSTTETVEIKDAMQVKVTALKGATCGADDGMAVASITGGQSPYEYYWSNSESVDDTNSVMAPGLHSIRIVDANNCYAIGSVTINNDGSGPQIDTVAILTHNNCYGDQMGKIDINITGGATPYILQWSNGEKTVDIDSLTAGVYDLIVIDQDSCVAAASYEITQPPRLSVSSIVENASCNTSDGRAVAVVSGGTEPYFYSWSTGDVLQIAENLEADIYSVTVTDIKGCQELEPVIVNNVGGPTVSIDSVTGVTCADQTNGAIDISVSGGTPLYTYDWDGPDMFDATTQDVTGLLPGEYKVRVEDAAQCDALLSAVIIQDPPAVNEICLVTVDSVSGKNLIMWERNGAADIDHFNIYRESSQKNVYQLIHEQPVAEETRYVDSVADPMIRSWKYRISVVDVCGNESEPSIPHKTMHLTINLGWPDNTINLIWDHYEGFDVSTYRVWRRVDGLWTMEDEFASTSTSWTDPDAPETGDLHYFVEVVHPTGCTSTELKASTLNTSRSNRQTTSRQKGSGISDLNAELYNLSVFPNPSTGVFNIGLDLETPEDVDLKLFDLSGKLVYANSYKAEIGRANIEIDLSGYANGLYYLNLRTENGLFNRILVKE